MPIFENGQTKISISSKKSEEFNFKDIEVLVDKDYQQWFKSAHVGKSIELA